MPGSLDSGEVTPIAFAGVLTNKGIGGRKLDLGGSLVMLEVPLVPVPREKLCERLCEINCVSNVGSYVIGLLIFSVCDFWRPFFNSQALIQYFVPTSAVCI